MIVGAGPPADSTGTIGQFYVDEVDNVMYGPKSDGTPTTPLESCQVPPTVAPYSGGYTQAERFVFADDGIVTSVEVYISLANVPLTGWTASVWSDDGNQTQLAHVAGTLSGTVPGWLQLNFANPLEVSASKPYYVGLYFPIGANNRELNTTIDPTTIHYGDISCPDTTLTLYYLTNQDGFPNQSVAGYFSCLSPIFQRAPKVWPIAMEGAPSPLTLTAPNPSEIPLTLVGGLNQTANLFEVKDNAGNWMAAVTANGALYLHDGADVYGQLSAQDGQGNLQPINPWKQLTQAQYNALSPPDPNTLYVIVG